MFVKKNLCKIVSINKIKKKGRKKMIERKVVIKIICIVKYVR